MSVGSPCVSEEMGKIEINEDALDNLRFIVGDAGKALKEYRDAQVDDYRNDREKKEVVDLARTKFEARAERLIEAARIVADEFKEAKRRERDERQAEYNRRLEERLGPPIRVIPPELIGEWTEEDERRAKGDIVRSKYEYDFYGDHGPKIIGN